MIYLRRTGRSAQVWHVYAGVGLAVLVSLAGAAGFSLVGLNRENKVLEGVLLAIAAVLVLTMVAWMWRTSRHIDQYIKTQLDTLSQDRPSRQGWGLLGFTFFMVAREGIEIVLFLAALLLATEQNQAQLGGGVIGLGLAVLLGVLLVKGSVRMNLRRFFGLTALVLVVLVVRFVVGSIHEFAEAGVLSESIGDTPFINFIINDSTSLVTLAVLVLLPFLAMLPSKTLKVEGSNV